MAESNGRRNGRMTGMAGMAERQKEWQNDQMAEMDTYVLFMVHTDTNTNTDNNDDDDTLIFYSIDIDVLQFVSCDRCIYLECNKFVLVLVQVKLIQFECPK